MCGNKQTKKDRVLQTGFYYFDLSTPFVQFSAALCAGQSQVVQNEKLYSIEPPGIPLYERRTKDSHLSL